MKTKTVTDEVRSFERRISNLDSDKRKFLHRHGWRSSSAYPDYCWRWSKELNGVVVTVPDCNVDEAIGLELASFLKARRDGENTMRISEISTEQ